MSRESILNTLIAKKQLTTSNAEALGAINTDKEFLQALLNIYETKITTYLMSCTRGAAAAFLKKDLYTKDTISAMATQQVIAFTFKKFLELEPASLLLSLGVLLKETAPELAVSLGLSLETNANDTASKRIYPLKEQMSQVFVRFLAREQLVQAVNVADLEQVCAGINSGLEDLFPNYLLQALAQQKMLKVVIAARVAEQVTPEADVTKTWSKELANNMNTYPNAFFQCLSGMVLYISKVLKGTKIPAEQKVQFFSHLNQEQQLQQFAGAVCQGYLQAMRSEERVLRTLLENGKTMPNEIHKVCVPNLALLGITLTVNPAALENRKQEIDRILAECQERMKTIERDTEKAKASRQKQIEDFTKNNLERIDKGVAQSKETVEKSIDQQRADFKPTWSVSGTTGMDPYKGHGPSIGFKF